MSNAPSTWTVVAVVLLAVLAGAAIPVLYQLQRMLADTRQFVRRLDTRLDATLKEVQETGERVNRIGRELDERGEDMQRLMDAVAGIARPLEEIQASVEKAAAVGKAVGPAIVAGYEAFVAYRATRDARGAEPEYEPEDDPVTEETSDAS